MDFTIDCSCGANLRVTTGDAGGTKRCHCGNINPVPSLGELRRRAGQQRYDVSIADKISYLVADGELPAETACIQCGIDTSNVLQCKVECERPYVKGRGFWSTVLLGLFAPFWILGALSRDYQNSEVHGRELIVNTPLALCPECAATSQAEKEDLHDLLRRVPLYDQLLQEYPNANVRIS
jgi:hypothetical protein